MKIRSMRPEFFSDTLMASLSPLARILYIGFWCIADDEGRGRYLPKQIEGEVFPNEQVDIYALLAELLSTARIVTYQDGGELYFHIPNFTKYQKPNRTYPSRLPAPPLFTPNGHTADAVREQDRRSVHAPPVLGRGSKGVEEPNGSSRNAESDIDRDGIWTALEDVFGKATTRTERSLRGKLVKSLAEAGATYTSVKERSAAWPKLFPGRNGQPPPTCTDTALEKWWGALGLIVETGKPPPPCPICDSRRIVGVSDDGEIVKVDDPRAVGSERCSCVRAL